MGSKAPKKKESRERVASAAQRTQEPPTAIPPIFEKDENRRKGGRVAIPVWPEWSDQEIASEKWDTGHRVRLEQKGRSPGTSMHFFEEPEGRLELPQSLKDKVYSWRRLQDAISDGKIPVMVDPECLKGKEFDLLSSSNEAVTDSELMRWIIAAISTLSKSSCQIEADSTCSLLKTKSSKEQRDTKESKNDKTKKESEVFTDEMAGWKPWHHIWPKEPNSRFPLAPLYNQGGKYCLKIFWMGCWRKITVDDFVPCDEQGNILLPTTKRDNELWPMLLSKALIKVASLDYTGGNSFSEMGDANIIHCLTGWLPEPIPLKYGHTSEIWKLLLDILPNWKLESVDSKLKLTEKDSKTSIEEELKKEETPRPDVKESKEGNNMKMKKEDKETKETGNKEKNDRGKNEKQKEKEKVDRDGKTKEKVGLASTTQARLNTEPEFVVFASYSPPPKTPLRISTLREMADASEKLRLSGLSHNHPHPVHVTMARNCPLVPPPTPVPIPRWKLIRQKKKTQIVEPPLNREPPKPPTFVELSSPFINYSVSPIPVSRVPTPAKWKKYKPETPMDSLTEEEKVTETENDSGMGTDEYAKEGKDENDNQIKENEIENTKQIGGEQQTNPPKAKQSISTEITVGITSEKEKPVEKEPIKVIASKSNLHLKKERINSGKSSLAEPDALDKKVGRKVSVASSRVEGGSAKGRKMSNFARSISEKDGTKEIKGKSKENLKERELPETLPEVEVTKPEDEATGENIENEAEKGEENGKEGEKKEKVDSLWMEYDDFCLCFSTLWIFHKSQTYSFYKGHSELKNADQKVEKNRRSVLNPAVSNIAPTPSGRNPSVASPSAYGSHQPFSDVPMPYLFVDSLSKIELLISFASFSRWFEPLVQTAPAVKEKEKDGSESEEKLVKESTPSSLPAGVLIAEPYSWKSLVTGLPSLRIKTTGIKAAVLSLPPGRHVLRFMIQAPIGYYVDICSQTSFVFGEEDVVMQNLTKESIRFTQHATDTMLALTDIMTSFQEPTVNRSKIFQLGSEDHSIATYSEHFQALFSGFSQITKSELGAAFTSATAFSIEALKHEVSLCLRKHLQAIEAREDDKSQEMTPVEEGNAEEQANQDSSERNIAATKIQSWFRGNFLRQVVRARDPGSEENKIVVENFKKIAAAYDANAESFALQIYREMFRENPELYKIFPFYNDEWTRIAYADYNGNYPEQPVNSWFIVFREVFFVQESVLVVPKLYINIPSCVLRVIDNDNGEELPMVFMRVAPKVLQKNKNGYTFVAEARSGNAAVPSGKFRMRLIGAADPLPAPIKENFINTNFTTKEIRDYYIPNRNNLIFRYTAKVADDHQVSIQVATSKPDVYIRLEILDNETVVATANGKGHVVLPAFTFLRDHNDDEEEKASHRSSRLGSGRSSVKGNRGQRGGAGKRAISPFEKSTKKSSKLSQSTNQSVLTDNGDKTAIANKLKAAESTETLDQSTDDSDQVQTHKYIIQAVVVRDSWPLSKGQWSFISMLRHIEKTDGEVETSTKTEKHSAGPKGKKGSKEGKESRTSKGHQQTSSSRPGSQQFDITKPNWVFRVVSDATSGEIEIKKDTERQDEIKAMKAAWEAEQPGRAAKAQQTRMKFLNENMIKAGKDGKDGTQDESDKKSETIENSPDPAPLSVSPSLIVDREPSELTLSPPAKEQEMILKPFDTSPYIRSTGNSVLLDEKEEERLRLEMENKIRKYREFRENVLQEREADRNARNLEKEKQLQEYEDMQAKLDENRHKIHTLREEYRQKFIDQPPADNASEVSKKRKTPSPTRGRKSPRSKSPKEKTKSKSPSKGKKK